MTYNLTQRVQWFAASVLHVDPTASTPVLIDRLTVLTGVPGHTWLTAGARNLPTDLYLARAVEAARVLAADPTRRSRDVVAFLASDAKLPEIDRVVQPHKEHATEGRQLALIS
jgi:hypothetical protein